MELSAKSMGQPLWCGYKVTEEVSGTRWGRCFPGEDFWRRSSTTSPNSSPGVHRSHDSSLSVNKLSWLEDKTHWQRWLSLLLAWLSSQWASCPTKISGLFAYCQTEGLREEGKEKVKTRSRSKWVCVCPTAAKCVIKVRHSSAHIFPVRLPCYNRKGFFFLASLLWLHICAMTGPCFDNGGERFQWLGDH